MISQLKCVLSAAIVIQTNARRFMAQRLFARMITERNALQALHVLHFFKRIEFTKFSDETRTMCYSNPMFLSISPCPEGVLHSP